MFNNKGPGTGHKMFWAMKGFGKTMARQCPPLLHCITYPHWSNPQWSKDRQYRGALLEKSKWRVDKSVLLLKESIAIETSQYQYTGRTLKTKRVKDMSCLLGFDHQGAQERMLQSSALSCHHSDKKILIQNVKTFSSGRNAQTV